MKNADDAPTRADEVPDELVQVKRVQSAPRAVIGGLLLLAGVVALWVGRDGWRYFLRSRTPVKLGRAEDAVKAGKLRHNTYVTLDLRAMLNAEGRLQMADAAPGCLTGTKRSLYFTLVAETGDHLVLRTGHSLKHEQKIPKRVHVTGRLLRIASLPETHQMYRRFVYRLTDCRNKPAGCDRSLLMGADILKKALLPQLGRPKAVLHGKAGHRIEVRRKTPLFLMFHYADQWDYRLSKITKDEAIAKVKTLGVPWVHTESKRDDHYFVLKAPRAWADRLIKAQRRGKGYSISARTAGFLTTFGRLRRHGDDLIIRRAGPGFPEDYVVAPAKAGESPTLTVRRQGDLVRVPLARFVKASYHGPRHLPDDAFLLVEGVALTGLAAAIMAGGALVVSLLGLALFILGLRRPRA